MIRQGIIRQDRLALHFANAGHLLTHLLQMLWPTVVLGLEGKFGLTYGELLALSVPASILFGVVSLPAGWLGDRWSTEGMMVIFFIGSGVSAILTGLANGPLGIATGLALTGAFGSIYHPVGFAWLLENARQRGRVLAWNGIFGSMGLAAASTVAGTLTALGGWRAAFIVPGLIAIGFGAALAVLVRRKPAHPVHHHAAAAAIAPEPADIRRAFIVLSITMTAAGLVWQALTVSLPKLYDERLIGLVHGNIAGTGAFVSAVFLLSGGFQLLGGWLADRYPMKLLYLITWAVAVPLLIVMGRLAELPLVLLTTLIFSLIVISTPVENSLLAHYTPGRWRATAFGAKFVLSSGVTAVGTPLVAYMHDRGGGFGWLYVVLAGLAMLLVAAGLLLPREPARNAAPVPVPAE